MSEAKKMAEEYYNQGIRYESDADSELYRERRIALYQKAANAYLKAAELNPSDEMPWIMAGLMYFDHLDDPYRALQYWNKAAEVNPKNYATQCKVANALLVCGEKTEAYNEYDRVIQGFMEYTARDQYKARAAWHWADHMVQAGRICCWYGAPDKALDLFEAALQLNPRPDTYPEEWPREQGEEAVAETRTQAYARKGVALLLLGREQEAERHFEVVDQIDPEDAIGFFEELSGIYERLGKKQEAQAAYERALQIDPVFFTSWVDRADKLCSIGRWQEAVAACDRALETIPIHPKAWNIKAIALGQLGRTREEIAAYEKTLEFDPDNVVAWSNKGAALAKEGRLEEALTAFDQAIEIDPDYSAAWYNKGGLLANAGYLRESLPYLKRALQLGDTDAAEIIEQVYALLA